MLKTFSKIYGMAGLRLGWMYAPDGVVDIINRMRSPFNVSYSAIVAGIAATKDDNFIKLSITSGNQHYSSLIILSVL